MDHNTVIPEVSEYSKCETPFCATRGDIAPLFTSEALINGKIENVSLVDLRNEWTILFFYSSDFTFV